MNRKISEKITSNHIKAALLSNFRFANNYPIIATEAGLYKADVIALNPIQNKFIEVEVKISKTDLLSDLKKPKHFFYKKIQGDYVPRQFYYCVPNDLVDVALDMVKDLPYGVIRYRTHSHLNKDVYDRVHNRVIIVKRAKNLHNNNIQSCVIDDLIKRMASELANYAIREVEEDEK